jgi:hypothetical protein
MKKNIILLILIFLCFSFLMGAGAGKAKGFYETPTNDSLIFAKMAYLTELTATANNTLGTAINPLFVAFSEPEYYYPITLPINTTLLPFPLNINQSTFIDKITITYNLPAPLYIIDTVGNTVATISQNFLGTFYMGYKTSVYNTVSFYSSITASASIVYGSIFYRNE